MRGVNYGNGTALHQWLEVFDWDGAGGAVTNIAAGKALVINAERIDLGDATTDGFDGTVNINGGQLVVNTGPRIVVPTAPGIPQGFTPVVVPTPWRLDGTMNLSESAGNAAVVATHYGAPLEVHGNLHANSGNAVLSLPVLLKEGTVHVAGGATLQSPLAVEGGLVDVDAGGMFRISNRSTFGPGTRMQIDGEMELNADTTFRGGIYAGTGRLSQRDDALFENSTALYVPASFAAGSTNMIATARQLSIGGGGSVAAGALFNGGGTVRNLASSSLRLDDHAIVDVPFFNDGRLVLGDSTTGASLASARVKNYDQSASGFLAIEIGAGQADFLDVAETASLDGTLEVSVASSFQPPMDATTYAFEILHAAGGVMGTFVDHVFPALAGYDWDVDYTDTSVWLNVSWDHLPADFNRDGLVNGEDFLAWQTYFPTLDGSATPSMGDANGDGNVDGGDFLVWQSLQGSSGYGGGRVVGRRTRAGDLGSADGRRERLPRRPTAGWVGCDGRKSLPFQKPGGLAVGSGYSQLCKCAGTRCGSPPESRIRWA